MGVLFVLGGIRGETLLKARETVGTCFAANVRSPADEDSPVCRGTPVEFLLHKHLVLQLEVAQ